MTQERENPKDLTLIQRSIFKLAILGILAISILLIGNRLQKKLHKEEIETDRTQTVAEVSEVKPTASLPSPSDELLVTDNAIIEIAEKVDNRLLSLPNGGIGIKFKDTDSIICLGGAKLKIASSVKVESDSNKTRFVRNFDPTFALTLLEDRESNIIKISQKDIRPGEILIGVKNYPKKAIWVTRAVTVLDASLDQRWFEQIITNESPPPEFSGILINSRAELVGIIDKGRILSRAFIEYWTGRAFKMNPLSFASIPARLSPTDPSLLKYLGLSGLVIDEPIQTDLLQQGDILLQVNGRDITGIVDLAKALRNFSPGQIVPIMIYRNNEMLPISISLADHTLLEEQAEKQLIKLSNYLDKDLLRRGKLIFSRVETGNPLYNFGLRSGDQIISINYQEVRDLKGLKALTATFQETDRALLLRVTGQNGQRLIAIPKEMIEVE
jgi:hypothetical protein